MENRWTRDGLIVSAVTTRASGHAERLAAVALIEPHADGRSRSCSVPTTGTTPVTSSIKLRDKAVTPHVAQDQSGRRSAIDHRTTRRPGYAVSQHIRKRIGEAVGWPTVVRFRKMRHRGLPKVDWQFTLAMAAYDLIPLAQLACSAHARNL